MLRVCQEGLERVVAQVGAEGDGVGAQGLKGRPGIGLGGGGDIAALGIQDHRDVRPARRRSPPAAPASPRPEGFEESRVGLEGQRPGRRWLRSGAGRNRGPPCGGGCGQVGRVRVQPDAQQRIDLPGARIQLRKKLMHSFDVRRMLRSFYALPSTIASSAMRTYRPYSIWRK